MKADLKALRMDHCHHCNSISRQQPCVQYLSFCGWANSNTVAQTTHTKATFVFKLWRPAWRSLSQTRKRANFRSARRGWHPGSHSSMKAFSYFHTQKACDSYSSHMQKKKKKNDVSHKLVTQTMWQRIVVNFEKLTCPWFQRAIWVPYWRASSSRETWPSSLRPQLRCWDHSAPTCPAYDSVRKGSDIDEYNLKWGFISNICDEMK